MAFKYVILLVAAVGAASLQDRNRDHSQQQQRHPVADSQDQRSDESVGYDFSYSVHDPNTGDVKSQEESRRNGNVRGRYSWIDADGNRQIVDYQADDHNGFNSEHRQEPALRPRPSHVLVPAPLYTIDTVIAPVWTSASRSDNTRSRSRQSHSRSDRDRDQDRNQEDHDQRIQHDGQDNDRENHRNEHEQDNRDDRDSRDSREQRREDQHRDDEQQQHQPQQQQQQQQQQHQRQRSRDERGRGRDSHTQSEVRFQAADVAYQYSN